MLKSLPRFLCLLIAVMLCVTVAAAQDTPPEDTPISPDHLTLIARYAWHDTSLLGVIYTDEAALESLDSTVRDLTAGLTGSQPIGFVEALRAVGFPYDDALWVGDFMAITVTPDKFNPRVSLIIHVADHNAALAYIARSGVDERSYKLDGDIIVVNVQTGFSSMPRDIFPAAGHQLLDVPVFDELRTLLPAERYGVFVYADMPILMQTMNRSSPRYAVGDGILYAALARSSGITAAGLTYAEDGAITLNVASTGANLRTLEALNLTIAPESVSAESLAYIPENALMAVQGHDLLGFPLALWDEHLGSIIPQMLIGLQSGYYSASQLTGGLFASLSSEERLDLLLSALLGLNEEELSSLIGDDYVIFATDGVNQATDHLRGMSLNFAAVFTLDDDAAAFELFEVLARSAQLTHAGAGNNPDLSVDVTRIGSAGDAAPYRRLDLINDNLRLMLPVNKFSLVMTEDVLILGTNDAVDAAFAQVGAPPAAWVAAQAGHLNDGAFLNVLVQPETVLQLVRNLESIGENRGLPPSALIAKLAGLSATYAVNDDNAQLVQIHLAYNDAAAMETVLAAHAPQPTPVPVQPTNTAIPPAPTVVPTLTPLPTLTVTPPPPPSATPFTLLGQTSFPTTPVDAVGYDGLLLHRGDDGAFILGSPDAPQTLVVFSDWLCPHCQTFEPVIAELVAQDLASGDFNIEHRTLVTAGQGSTPAATALAECVDALAPGTFWAVRAYLYEVAEQTPDLYRDSARLAAALSTEYAVNNAALSACQPVAAQRTVDAAYAASVGAPYTPYAVIRSADGALNPIQDMTVSGIRAALQVAAAPAPVMDNAQATRAANLANLAATRAAPTAAP